MQFTIIKCKDLQHTSVFIKCQDVQKHNKGVRGEFLGEQWRRRGGGGKEGGYAESNTPLYDRLGDT